MVAVAAERVAVHTFVVAEAVPPAVVVEVEVLHRGSEEHQELLEELEQTAPEQPAAALQTDHTPSELLPRELGERQTDHIQSERPEAPPVPGLPKAMRQAGLEVELHRLQEHPTDPPPVPSSTEAKLCKKTKCEERLTKKLKIAKHGNLTRIAAEEPEHQKDRW